MTTLTAEQFKIRLSIWRDAIPTYEGGTRKLSHFISSCDELVQDLATNDERLNLALFSLIKAKLKDQALDLVLNNSPVGWAACKALLINRFSDPSSEEILINRLSTCYQQHNQTYEEYADEIKSRLNRIKEHVQLNESSATIKVSKIAGFEKKTKNIFIDGVKEPYHTYLMNFESANIEECLNRCRVYDDHQQNTSFLNFMRQKDFKPKNNSTNGNQKNIFGNNMIPRNQNVFQPNQNVFQPRQNVFQPRSFIPQQQPQMPFTPVFKTNHPNQNEQYKPTPMSVNTRNSYRPMNTFQKSNNSNSQNIRHNSTFIPNKSNYFKSTGPPNFISEELFNQEEQVMPEEQLIHEETPFENEGNQDFHENSEENQNFHEVFNPEEQT